MTVQPDAPPVVSVIVINYNSGDHLAECLAALCASQPQPAIEILVVDNASTDDSLALGERLAAVPRPIRFLKSRVNRGYAGGVNLAFPHTRGSYVAALNPDMRVSPDWLAHLVPFLESHPEAGAVNPLILLHDTDEHINAAGQDIHVTGLGFNRRLGQPRSRAGLAPARVSGIQGGAVVVRRALLQEMGGWDESGFLYHEDVALSWRLHLMGCDLYCIPRAIVWHDYHLTMYPEKLFLLERNRAALLLTHLESWSLLYLAPFLLLTELLMWGYCLLRGWGFIKAKAASYQWIARQRAALRDRRTFIRGLRRRTDWQVLKKLKWGYAWDQLLTLGRERGESRRQPAGGMPVKMGESR